MKDSVVPHVIWQSTKHQLRFNSQSSNPRVTRLNTGVTGSNPVVTSLNQQVTSSNP